MGTFPVQRFSILQPVSLRLPAARLHHALTTMRHCFLTERCLSREDIIITLMGTGTFPVQRFSILQPVSLRLPAACLHHALTTLLHCFLTERCLSREDIIITLIGTGTFPVQRFSILQPVSLRLPAACLHHALTTLLHCFLTARCLSREDIIITLI